MEIHGQTFKGIVVNELSCENRPARLTDCVFSGCGIGMKVRQPAGRLVVKDVTAINCTVDAATVGPVVFENLYVEQLRTIQHLWLPGCAFKNCVFKGHMGEVLQFDRADPMSPRISPFNQRFIDANESIWSAIDWSLDISEAEFTDFDLRGVPGETVRINGHNQVCVDFEKANVAQDAGAFDELQGFSKMVMVNGMKRRRDSKYNFVLVTQSLSSDYQELMNLFSWLDRRELLLAS